MIKSLLTEHVEEIDSNIKNIKLNLRTCYDKLLKANSNISLNEDDITYISYNLFYEIHDFISNLLTEVHSKFGPTPFASVGVEKSKESSIEDIIEKEQQQELIDPEAFFKEFQK